MAKLDDVQGNPKDNAELDFGSEDFFDSLDDSVNGMVQDQPGDTKTTEVTPKESGSDTVTHTKTDGSKVDWEKRYKDSSKSAVNMAGRLKDLQPFVPVLEAMKRDSGLVEHVRDYLTQGGKPADTIQKKLGLDEDFVFDAHEAMSEPDSDSAKVMGAHVDGLVQARVGQVVQGEKQRNAKMQALMMKKRQEAEFVKRHNMSKEEYNAFVEESKKHRLSLDDIYFLVNKDKAAKNTADATKKDMLGQMKAVRDIPASAGDSNSQPAINNPDELIFNALAGLDGDVDDLFGGK
mgnify:CR=1 FL=1